MCYRLSPIFVNGWKTLKEKMIKTFVIIQILPQKLGVRAKKIIRIKKERQSRCSWKKELKEKTYDIPKGFKIQYSTFKAKFVI